MHGGRVCLARAGHLARGCARSRVRGRPVLQRPTVAMETAKEPGKKPSTGPGVARLPCTAPSCLHTRVRPCTKGRCMRVLPHTCHPRARMHRCSPCVHTLAHACSLAPARSRMCHLHAHASTRVLTVGARAATCALACTPAHIPAHACRCALPVQCSLGLHTHTRAPLVHTHRAQTCVLLVHAHICTHTLPVHAHPCSGCKHTSHGHAPCAHARALCAHPCTRTHFLCTC